MTGRLWFAKHYAVETVPGDAWEFVRKFPPDEMNWVLFSTSGVHGSYTTLDGVSAILFPVTDADKKERKSCDSPSEWDVTVLIVQPRLVVCYYGNLPVSTKEQIEELRGICRASLAGIAESQKGNT